MKKSAIARAAMTLLAAFACFHATRTYADESAVSARDLADKAAASAKGIKTDGASWSTLIDVRHQAFIQVDRVVRGDNSLWRISMTYAGKTQKMAEVVEKAGVWYVSQNGKREKFRPREAPLSGLNPYIWMSMSDPLFYSSEGNPTLSRDADGTVVATIPLPDDQRQQAASLVQQLRQLMATNPASVKPELKQTVDELQRMVDHGIEQHIDPQTGVVTSTANPKFKISTRDFRFLTAADDKAFQLNESDYTDKTASILADKAALIMIANSASWRPGDPVGDMDLMLLNSKTGEYRRVPYDGAVATAGCFSLDRESVFVTGIQLGAGAMVIVKVNLKSGVNSPLTGKYSSSGINMFARLSPDGKYLCFMHEEPGRRLLESNIIVADLSTGEERIVGDAGDYGPAAWAQANLLVLTVREKADLSDPAQANTVAASTLCTMDLAGKVTKVVRGNLFEVVLDGKSLLFEDDNVWKICDLDGKNERIFGDGLPHDSFPAVSPDGKSVLMMRYAKGKAPTPVIINLSDATEKPITTGPGFWGMADWK